MVLLRPVRTLAVLALVAAPLTAVVALPTGAGATAFNVTNANDSGAGSLRQALADAAANSGDDVVEVQAGLGTITLTSGEIVWSGNGAVTIHGNGVTLNAGGAPAALVDDGGDGVTINGMTITGVGGSLDEDLAPVVSQGGAMSLSDCTISGNSVHSTDGDAAGAVLSEGGSVTVQSCTFSGNSAVADDGDAGGGINSEGGAVVVATSTITKNSATASGDAGGGILSEGGGITIRDSSITCNSASAPTSDAGGGIASEGGGVTINGSTVVGNTATGADSSKQIFISGGGSPSGSGNTISDDTSSCAAPPTTTTTTTTTAPPPVVTQPTFTG